MRYRQIRYRRPHGRESVTGFDTETYFLDEYGEEIRTIGEGGGGMLAWAECEQGKVS
jgi:hypothetical protein